jgi:tyrosine-protein phosphatase SIW14
MLFIARLLTVVVVFALPLVLARFWIHSQRNFRVVEAGVLYRSGQMDIGGLRRAIHDHGIRTVVTLRDDTGAGSHISHQEKKWVVDHGLNYHALPVRAWYPDQGEREAPALENVRQLLGILADKNNHPVLVHCFAGFHRTGIYVAICRMERDGWDLERAIHEMRTCGYNTLDEHADVQAFLYGYRPAQK